MEPVDLRSDTVTRPSNEMKEFMFSAPVGDDVFEEDPTIQALEKYAADLFGKEAGLYCVSGTQTNQIAINVYCKPGDEVICSKEAHIYKYEGGGIAKNSGSSVKLLDGDRGRINVESVQEAYNDPENVHFPITALVALEDTMNRGGGSIYNPDEIKKIKSWCEAQKLPLHLDGARVFNALVETGIDYQIYGKMFDSISICLSKGLGAPVGSVLVGTSDFIKKARRVRKVLGGGMRQGGIIAAGGLFALKNNISRLKDDHQRAKQLEKALKQCSWIDFTLETQTNIVVASVTKDRKVDEIIRSLENNKILAMPFGGNMIRMVTHLDNSDEQIDHVVKTLKKI
ncbi:MAG: GntG family PLP-dependent aldolase [Brumimicrobium sp.]|nr:GntG family PLP-dependent aldolase [Brumimicrobium sp.]